MSLHPSLRSSDKGKKQRSVLKRIERVKMMQEKGAWKEGDGFYGLPKIKTIRIKIKKEKAEKVETTATGAPSAAATPEAKEQTATKGQSLKQEKK